jgi:hypothetical protein
MSQVTELLEKALKVKARISPDYSEHTIKLAVDEMAVLIEDALKIQESYPDVRAIEYCTRLKGKTYNPDPPPTKPYPVCQQPPAGDFTKECREVVIEGPVENRHSIWVKRLLEACDRLDASEASLLKALEPVIDWYWYGGGSEGNRSSIEILTDVVSDLQKDRAEVLRLRAAISEAKKA